MSAWIARFWTPKHDETCAERSVSNEPRQAAVVWERSLAVRLQCGEHDVRSGEQLGDRGRGVRKAPGIDHGGLRRPEDADHGRHAVRFDHFDCELIMVDLTGC
jgi:hypothetical protein